MGLDYINRCASFIYSLTDLPVYLTVEAFLLYNTFFLTRECAAIRVEVQCRISIDTPQQSNIADLLSGSAGILYCVFGLGYGLVMVCHLLYANKPHGTSALCT